MGVSSSKLAPQVNANSLSGGIPTVVDVKFGKALSKYKIELSSPQTGSRYLVTLPYSFWGTMIFHDGPSKTDPVWMVVRDGNKLGTKYEIKLPRSPYERRDLRSVYLHWVYRFAHSESYWFDLDVGRGSDRQVERFEWRRSRGKEVSSLEMSIFGWKLVRVPPGEERRSDRLGRKERDEGFASDGGEVVAVWGARNGWYDWGHFELRGSGATGELGESFALMALASSITIEYNSNRVTSNV